MLAESWVIEALGAGEVETAREAVGRIELLKAIAAGDVDAVTPDEFTVNAVELAVYDELTEGRQDKELFALAFSIMRAQKPPDQIFAKLEWFARTAAIGILADRSQDSIRFLQSQSWTVPSDASDWPVITRITILDAWLRIFRRDGWDDLDEALSAIARLRKMQLEYEARYLEAEARSKQRAAWELVSLYHLAKAVETLALFIANGEVDEAYDIDQQLEAQFDRVVAAARHAQLGDLEVLSHLLMHASRELVDASIWSLTRAVSSNVTDFVRALLSRDNRTPIFELLPPQRKALRDNNLIGTSLRSVVLSLPTSSGKTLIALFRILQALNQFESNAGWVAYLVPTRALVNQISRRLRSHLAPLGINVERISPALEIDSIESDILTDKTEAQFRVLVTTPEKFDLLIRQGWEEAVGRPLTLVVVDEAHNLGNKDRGITLELLLATINRECRNAQFLLLTPFIENASTVAQWLDRNSYKDVSVGVDWRPNDIALGLCHPVRQEQRGDFTLEIETVYTNKNTIAVPEKLDVPEHRPLGLSWTQVSSSLGKLAASVGYTLGHRGPKIILAQKIPDTWSIAGLFKRPENAAQNTADIGLAKRFLALEYGQDFDLIDLLDYRVAVHHSGLSDEVKVLVEWLTETGQVDTLVSTTTIAQGINFPVSSIILASHQYPYGEDMPAADFWNLAGRVGRVGQRQLGLVLFASDTEQRAEKLKTFISRNIAELNSSLVELVRKTIEQKGKLQLEELAYIPQWSHFLQYLAHSYRVATNKEKFIIDIEQLLRGTLGFQELRKMHSSIAVNLLSEVRRYATTLAGQPLKSVDNTGFSLETVKRLLHQLRDEGITQDTWDVNTLFGPSDRSLRKVMGVLLRVPELREQFKDVLSGDQHLKGNKLALIIRDWVNGQSLPDLAREHFKRTGDDATTTLTRCSKELFGKITGAASWGISALQSLTLGDALDDLNDSERDTVRNIPARVQYGVNNDSAIGLRLLGVPRMAAIGLTSGSKGTRAKSIPELRAFLRQSAVEDWVSIIGPGGNDYYRVWQVLEGL